MKKLIMIICIALLILSHSIRIAEMPKPTETPYLEISSEVMPLVSGVYTTRGL